MLHNLRVNYEESSKTKRSIGKSAVLNVFTVQNASSVVDFANLLRIFHDSIAFVCSPLFFKKISIFIP